MNLFFLLIILAVFAYFTCNLGSSNKPGHTSYGFAPVLWVVVVCLIGWLLWPALGPAVSWFLLAFGGVK